MDVDADVGVGVVRAAVDAPATLAELNAASVDVCAVATEKEVPGDGLSDELEACTGAWTSPSTAPSSPWRICTKSASGGSGNTMLAVPCARRTVDDRDVNKLASERMVRR